MAPPRAEAPRTNWGGVAIPLPLDPRVAPLPTICVNAGLPLDEGTTIPPRLPRPLDGLIDGTPRFDPRPPDPPLIDAPLARPLAPLIPLMAAAVAAPLPRRDVAAPRPLGMLASGLPLPRPRGDGTAFAILTGVTAGDLCIGTRAGLALEMTAGGGAAR